MTPGLDYDRLLARAGTSGFFQIYFVVFTGFCNILTAFLLIGLPYLQAEPNLQCQSLNNNNVYLPCSQEEACSGPSSRFRVSKSHFFHNFITDFSMECATPYHIGLIGSSYFLGYTLGSIVFAPLADTIGRKKVIALGAAIFAATMVYMLLFAQSVEALYIGMFFIGLRSSSNSQVVYVMMTEYTDMSSRLYYCIACNVLEAVMNFFAGFYYTLGGNYRSLYFGGAILACIVVLWTLLGVPESPRYLKSQGLHHQAKSDFAFIARINGNLQKFQNSLHEEAQEDQLPLKPDSGKIQITRGFLVSIGVVSVNWFVCVLCAYGLHFGIKYLNSSLSVTMNLLSISEILSAATFGVVGSQFPRKRAYVLSAGGMIVCALATQYMTYLGSGELVGILVSVGIFLTKLFNGVMFSLVYIVTCELFPTKIRGTMFGVANMLGRMGGLLAPMVVEFEKHYFLPFFAVASLVSAAATSLFLRETKGLEIAD